jgi:hypothetical protein
MKKFSKIFTAISLLFSLATVQAAGTASTTISISGSFTPTCSFVVNSANINLGEINLYNNLLYGGGDGYYLQFNLGTPIGVSCNYPVPWAVTSPKFTYSIGGNASNTGHLSKYSYGSGSTLRDLWMINNAASDNTRISGTGTKASIGTLYLIAYSTNTTAAWVGTGAIAATIPLTLTF